MERIFSHRSLSLSGKSRASLHRESRPHPHERLARHWTDVFTSAHPDILVQVSGGGTATGITALTLATIDISTASRPLTQLERDSIGKTVKEIRTARDGLTIFLNPSNPISSLTFADLQNIYTGHITNWKEVGGPDLPINLYGRENTSGTYAFLKEHVLNKLPYSPKMLGMPGTKAIVNAVQQDPGGIGYGGVGYAKDVKECAIRRTPTDSSYAPTVANITSGKYPISRYLYFYIKGDPSPSAKTFIDWVLSQSGQSIVKEEGFLPLS